MTSSKQKNSNKVQINIYQIQKFHENRLSHFRELARTKFVRKKRKIIIGKKKQSKNNKVFRWKRKTLINNNNKKSEKETEE